MSSKSPLRLGDKYSIHQLDTGNLILSSEQESVLIQSPYCY